MSNLRIPARPREITAQWLTEALRETGTIRAAAVRSFDMEVIAEGVGFIGELARLKLRYDNPEDGAPASLIAKFPATDPGNRYVGNLFRFYEREIRFYEEIAGGVELRTPRRYYSAMDIGAGQYALLLEDLAPARAGDQLASCSPEEAELALRELAKFQAAWWESPRLDRIEWMPFSNDPVNKFAEASYRNFWGPFLEKFGSRMPGWAKKTGEELGGRIGQILDGLARPPRTIIHGDYRLDNLVFGAPEGGDPLAVIDWQIASRGRGVFDIAYFMSASLRPDHRKAAEMQALRDFHRTVTKGARSAYSFDECLYDYRAATLFCLVYSVITGGRDLPNERSVALVNATLDRVLTAIEDLNAGAALADLK